MQPGKKDGQGEHKKEKTFGFLHKDTYFLAKEWLMKIYKQPARVLKRRGKRK